MRVHKLVDAGGERYLPFAMSKLRQLLEVAQQNGGYASTKLDTPDGFRIEVSVADQERHIRITGSSVRYEFFTSEHILREAAGASDIYMASPGYTIGESSDGFAHVVGSLTEVRGSRARPVYSQVFDPAITGNPLRWRAADPEEGLYVNPPWPGNEANAAKGWPVSWGAWQFQKAFEHIWWPDNGNLSIVSSTQAQSPGRNSQCNDLSPYKFYKLSNYDAFISDYGFDVPPAFVDASGKQSAAPDTQSEFVWWRRAAVQKGHFIATDNVGNFYVYPVQDYAAGAGGTSGHPQELPPANFKKYTPPYPAWVTLPTVGTYVALTQAWLWSFNKDATKCVSCPFSSAISEFYKPSYIFYAGALLPGHPDFSLVGGTWIDAREDVPGFVEFGIEVVPSTTADPMDFTVNFTLLRNQHSTDGAGRFIFDAAYSLPDLDETMGVPEDTLVTSEIEVFATNYDSAATAVHPIVGGGGTMATVDVTERVGPFRAEYVMNAYPGSLAAPTEIRRAVVWQVATGLHWLPADSLVTLNYPQFGLYEYQVSPTNNPTPPYGYSGGGTPLYATLKVGWLHMIDLRTMSISHTLDDFDTMVSETKLIVRNAEYLAASGSFGTPSYTPVVPAYSIKVPASATLTHSYVLDNVLDTVWGSGFNVHPAGHWSCSRGRGIAGYDIIKEYKKPARTHKTMFNKAFGQSRDYLFYGKYASYDGSTYRFNLDSGSSNWDLGSFRTQGVWITF